MWFFFVLILGMGALAFWMWKRPDPVQRDQANAGQSDLWLEQMDAQMRYAARISADAQNPDYARAYQLYSDVAKQHELPQAYMQMGLMHIKGLGRAQDLQSGISLLEKSFKLGADEAAYQLGQIFEQQQDVEKALYWYRHAVARGNLDAQYRIAELQPDDQQNTDLHKLKLLINNAEAGHADSQYQLAHYYLNASAQQDCSLGMAYLFRAAQQDHLQANLDLAQYYQQGKYLAQDLIKALQFKKRSLVLGNTQGLMDYQLAVLKGDFDADQRQRVYLDLLDQAKVQKNPQAKAILGTAHFHGWYIDHQETLGFRFWSEAANDGNACALRQIAALYFEAYLVADEPSKAFELYQYAESIEAHANSQFGMGLCYYTGRGAQKDAAKALQLMQQAAKAAWGLELSTEADVLYAIGLFYSQPLYPLPNHDRALSYLTMVSSQGHAGAQFYLWQVYAGHIFADVRDDAQAQVYLQQAASTGHAEAQYLSALKLLQADDEKGLESLQASAQQGHAGALNKWGDLYAQGKWVQKDLQRALNFYQQAANKLNPDAYANLAHLYSHGLGVERNLQSARSWLEKGSLMGHELSLERLTDIDDYLDQRSVL